MRGAGGRGPEQARGRPVDPRADVWAFGCVLWEMLTGRRLFEGEDATATAAAILTEEPDWSALPADTRTVVRRVLRWCLKKDPDRRLHDIADALIAMEEAGEDNLNEPQAQATSSWNARVLSVAVIVTGTVGIVAGGAAVRWLHRPAPAPMMAVQVETSEPVSPFAGAQQVAVSPDGRHLIYTVWDGHEQYLVHRQLHEFTARSIPGSTNGGGVFFSPDSQWVGFHAKGKLMKASLEGGDPIELCSGCGGGGTWSPAGDEIITAGGLTGGSVRRVPGAGGEATVVLDEKPGELWYSKPEFLPDGRAVLLELRPQGTIGLLDLDTLELTILIQSGYEPTYAASGHILFSRDQALFAVAFDARRRVVSGQPVQVLERVLGYGLSRSGLLAWVDSSALPGQCRSAWVDRQGVSTPLFEHPCLGQPRLSPDLTRVAMGNVHIVIYDLRTGIAQQLTSDADGWAHFPLWSPDGDRVVYAARSGGGHGGRIAGDLRDDIYSIPADFSGSAEQLFEHELNAVPCSFSPSGELVFQLTSAGKGDIWVLPADGEAPRRVVASDADEKAPTLSPDARWLAYSSDRSGVEEVYVEPFPDGGARLQVSNEGGNEPRWAPAGNELFYRDGARMIAVPVTAGAEFAITGERQVLFEDDAYIRGGWHVHYDVDHDGQRFLMVEEAAQDGQQPGADRRINLIVNWFSELERLVPTE